MSLLRRSLLGAIRSSKQSRNVFATSIRALTTPPSPSTDSESALAIQDPGVYDMILPKEPYVWGTSHITPRAVPPHVVRPPYAAAAQAGSDYTAERDAEFREAYTGDGRIPLGGDEEVRLRRAARLARRALRYAGGLVKDGVSTDSIDAALHRFVVSCSAYPSPLLYGGYPKACCTSVNNVVAHGIPDDRPLRDGDIVNVDVTLYLDGYHGDTSQTFLVGDVDETGRDLVRIANQALEAGISACGPGRPFRGIGKAISELLKGRDYSVSSQFTGHGIGEVFHRPPWIFHDLNEEPEVMLPGHCFTIEPCIVKGNDPGAWLFPDGWTASTINGARSAQAEHMVLITESGADVITADDDIDVAGR